MRLRVQRTAFKLRVSAAVVRVCARARRGVDNRTVRARALHEEATTFVSLRSRALTPPSCAPLTAQIFDAFCARKALSADSVRFLFDGQRINPNMTPKDVSAPPPAKPLELGTLCTFLGFHSTIIVLLW